MANRQQHEAVASHPSAARFQHLVELAVANVEIPPGDVQEYDQRPHYGLYYRSSGRVITSELEGRFQARAVAGVKKGTFFELGRSGRVDPASPRIDRSDWKNPVHILKDPAATKYHSLTWVDESGLHRVFPNRRQTASEPTDTITVHSWTPERVLTPAFWRDPSAGAASRVVSEATDDPVLPYFERAARAYKVLTGLSDELMEEMLGASGE